MNKRNSNSTADSATSSNALMRLIKLHKFLGLDERLLTDLPIQGDSKLFVSELLLEYPKNLLMLGLINKHNLGGLSWHPCAGFAFTNRSTQIYNATIEQPPLSPPSIVFPIVWGILFALMGIGATRIYLAPASNDRTRSLMLFLIQLAFNFFWSIIFFNLQNFGLAFLWLIALWVLILLMILSFRKVDKLAAWLQIPYLIWVTFAAYLNFGVWLLNR